MIDIDGMAQSIVDVLRKCDALVDDDQRRAVLMQMIKFGIVPIGVDDMLACYVDLTPYTRYDIQTVGRAAYAIFIAPPEPTFRSAAKSKKTVGAQP
jgi:hypothetical protein